MRHAHVLSSDRRPLLVLALLITSCAAIATCANRRTPDSTLAPSASDTAATSDSMVACTVEPSLDGGLACSLESLEALSTPYTWRDDFDQQWPHGLWHWEREDAEHWSLEARPGYLRILAQDGDIYGARANQKNILLQPAPSGDFEVTTRIDFTPRFNFQHAGLMVYQDGDNYVHISRTRVREQRIHFDLEIDSAPTNIYLPYSADVVYLRLTRQSSTYSGYYSEDGVEWVLAGRFTVGLSEPRVGISAANNIVGLPPDPVDFDFFELQAQIPAFADCRFDGFGGATLDPHWAWMGENPALWSLTERPGFLRLFADSGGPGAQNLLYQPAPAGDLLLQAHLSFTPTANVQSAGWVAYQDADNYLVLGRRYCAPDPPQCLGDEVFFESYEDGERVGSSYARELGESGEVVVRLLREGEIDSVFFSVDGAAWTLLGRHTPALAAQQLGLSAWGDLSGEQNPADVDEVLICAEQLPPLETPTPTASATATATCTRTPSPSATPSATHTDVPPATATSPTVLEMLYLPVLHKLR